MSAVQEAEFLAKLAQVSSELQLNMALAQIISPLDEPTRRFLRRSSAYSSPVPRAGLLKLGQDLPQPAALLARLLAVSLLEQSYNPTYQAQEYFCSPVVVDWLKAHTPATDLTAAGELVDLPTLQQAAAYQRWLLDNERNTVGQAIITHTTMRRAQQTEAAHRFALDKIVSNLSNAGLYHTLLTEWLPDICQSTDAQTRADALNQTGKQYHHIGDYDAAMKYLAQALTIQKQIGDKAGEGTTLGNIATAYHDQGDYDSAMKYMEQSLTIYQQIGNKAGEGATLNNISQIYNARGDYETALRYLQQALTIYQQIGNKKGKSVSLNNIAQIYRARGDYETALRYQEQSLTICQQIGDKAGEGATLNNIATAYHAQKDYDSALKYMEQALTICQQIGDKAGEGATINNISQIYEARGDYETALRYLEQALTIQKQIGDKAGEGTALNNIAGIYWSCGDYETALRYLEQALTIQKQIGDMAGLCATLFNMGHIYLQNKQVQESLQAWVTVYRLASRMGEAQALQALEGLGLPGGLAGWAQLAERMGADTEKHG